MPSNKCLFLDRDGVIIEDIHLLQNEEDIKFLDGIADLIKTAKSLDYKIVMITNQTVVARGLLSLDETILLNNLVVKKLNEIEPGCEFDGIYLCPHHPNATNPEYRKDCECRKPKPGMLLDAARDLGIDLNRSYFVGDRASDIIAGNLANCNSILLEGKTTKEPIIESSLKYENSESEPNFIFQSLDKIKEVLKK